eukprot:m.48696 g.48696  ORF g.48696 m.48696 type:complete len:56 (-) comp6438_c0_seq2:2419-2586(-)
MGSVLHQYTTQKSPMWAVSAARLLRGLAAVAMDPSGTASPLPKRQAVIVRPKRQM